MPEDDEKPSNLSDDQQNQGIKDRRPKIGTFRPFTNLPPRDGEEISTHGVKTGDLEKRKKQ